MPSILLVEDDPFISDIYKKKFETSGFDVVNVTTGRMVLKAVSEKKFDLILLDLVIPELSGFEVMKELRGPQYDANLKIVVFSNLSNPEDRDRAVALGANGFISKTEFSPSQVVDEVNRYLRQFSEQNKNQSRTDGGKDPGVEKPVSSSAAPRTQRVLFVEDEAVFVDMFGKRLADEGYTVVTENNGNEAIARAQGESFDLIITDAMLPGMHGKDLIAQFRNMEQTEKTPIFVISASLDDEDMQEILKAGATRTFVKTKIVPSELVEVVNDFFEKESN